MKHEEDKKEGKGEGLASKLRLTNIRDGRLRFTLSPKGKEEDDDLFAKKPTPLEDTLDEDPDPDDVREPTAGKVHVYTGNGKGKTTASIGLAVRARGHNKKVLMVQFMKGDVEYGELEPLGKLGVRVEQFGRPDFVNPEKPDRIDVELALEGLEFAQDQIESDKWDLVILDEINVAAAWGLIPIHVCVEVIREKPERLELVLTGRYAPIEFTELADLVTNMREVKHYFKDGVKARDGVEH